METKKTIHGHVLTEHEKALLGDLEKALDVRTSLMKVCICLIEIFPEDNIDELEESNMPDRTLLTWDVAQKAKQALKEL